MITDLDFALVTHGMGFEAFPPWSDDERYKIPAPMGNRGCIWEQEEGTLQVFESGKPVGAEILDATGVIFPSRSPDGEYLAYISPPTDVEEAAVKLAFPTQKDMLRLEGSARAFMSWSVRSDWLAILKDPYVESPGLVVFTLPELESNTISESSLSPWNVQPLHDGSLAYVEEGKVFQWRPGWEEPVCVYDPGKETVLGSQK